MWMSQQESGDNSYQWTRRTDRNYDQAVVNLFCEYECVLLCVKKNGINLSF